MNQIVQNRSELNQSRGLFLSIFFAFGCLFTATAQADMCLDLFKVENKSRESTARAAPLIQQQVKVPKKFEDKVRSALKSILVTRNMDSKTVDIESSVAAILEGVSKLDGQVTGANFIRRFMDFDALTRQYIIDLVTFLDVNAATGKKQFQFLETINRRSYYGTFAEVIAEILNPKEGTFGPAERAHFDYSIVDFGRPKFAYNLNTRLVALQVLQSKLTPNNLSNKILVTQEAAKFLVQKADADPFVEQALAHYIKTTEDLMEQTGYAYKLVMAKLEIDMLRRQQMGLNQNAVPLRFLRIVLFMPDLAKGGALNYIMWVHSVTPLKMLPELEQIILEFFDRIPEAINDKKVRDLNPKVFDKFRSDYQL